MKRFLNTAKLFSAHSGNITFRILAALFIFGCIIPFAPSMIQFVPHVFALSVAVYTFTHLFTGKRAEGVMSAVTQADIFNTTQLQMREIVMAAIYKHYGWEIINGDWQKGATGKEIPDLLNKQRITRRDIYDTNYLTIGQDTFKFFDRQAASKPAFYSNLREVSLQGNKMYIFFGLVFELATGASATDAASALLFTTPTLVADAPVINGQASYRINTKQELDATPVKHLFVNDDAIKNYFRFPEPIVWEPGNTQEFELRLAAAYGATAFRYGRVIAVGFELVTD
jgi:hypothetical protein